MVIGSTSADGAELKSFIVRSIAPDVRVRSTASALSKNNIVGHSAPSELWDVYEIVPGPDEKGRIRPWYRAVNRTTRVEGMLASWVVTEAVVVGSSTDSTPGPERPWWVRAAPALGIVAALLALLTAFIHIRAQKITAASSKDLATAARLQLEAAKVELKVATLHAGGNAPDLRWPQACAKVLPFPRSSRENVRERLGIEPRTTRRRALTNFGARS
jgi:hypothetical protein